MLYALRESAYRTATPLKVAAEIASDSVERFSSSVAFFSTCL